MKKNILGFLVGEGENKYISVPRVKENLKICPESILHNKTLPSRGNYFPYLNWTGVSSRSTPYSLSKEKEKKKKKMMRYISEGHSLRDLGLLKI